MPCQSLGFSKVEDAFHFTVKTMPHLFQHDIGIGIFTWMLTDSSDAGKDFIYIRHIEVSAESQILARQLFLLKNGCTYEIPDFPVVE